MRILHLEDNDNDAELIAYAIRKNWPECQINQVKDESEFLTQLGERSFDLILSDYKIPSYDGGEALQITRSKGILTPFIFVSGTIGEALAVDLLKKGATDYILKGATSRLIPAIERALDDHQERLIQEQTKAALKESEARFRILVEESLVGIYLIQKEKLVYVNKALAKIVGYTQNELCSRPLLDFIAPGDRLMVADNVRKRLEGSISSVRYELKMLRKDGTVAYVEAHGTRSILNGLPAILGSLVDNSDKKQLEAQVQRAQRIEVIGSLASGIAHDLNNVLSPILMGIDMLRNHNSTPEDRDYIIETIDASAKRGASMVQKILSFARGSDIPRTDICIGKLILEEASLIKKALPSSIKLEVDVERSSYKVHANETEVYQVMMNLCINARDAMPEGGKLKLTVEDMSLDALEASKIFGASPGFYSRIIVSDTGVGIPQGIIDKIFDPFFTTKSLSGGTGLGLSTSLGIVKSLNGFLGVESKPGSGTSFTIYLPSVT